MMRWRCRCAAALMGALSLPAMAGSTTALQQRLQQLRPEGSLQARVTLDQRERNGSGDHPDTSSAQVTFRIDAGADGLSVHIPAAVLARADAEVRAHARDPDKPTPLHAAIGSIDPLTLQGMADFAPVLLEKLDGAHLLSSKATTRKGLPARRLTFDIPSGIGKADKGAIKHYEGRLEVWLDASGTPLAVHEERHYKGRKFFISFSVDASKDYTLQRLGQRLVVRDYRRVNGGSGLGQSNHTEIDVHLAPVTSDSGGRRQL
jgi:hypothetical protein